MAIATLTPAQVAACKAARATVHPQYKNRITELSWRTVAQRLALSPQSVLQHFDSEALVKYQKLLRDAASRNVSRAKPPRQSLFTEAERELIKRSYRDGMSAEWVALKIEKRVGRITVAKVFAELAPKYGAERDIALRSKVKYRGTEPGLRPAYFAGGVSARPAPHMIADRDRRMDAYYAQPAYVQLMGDPPPGQSALDRRK